MGEDALRQHPNIPTFQRSNVSTLQLPHGQTRSQKLKPIATLRDIDLCKVRIPQEPNFLDNTLHGCCLYHFCNYSTTEECAVVLV